MKLKKKFKKFDKYIQEVLGRTQDPKKLNVGHFVWLKVDGIKYLGKVIEAPSDANLRTFTVSLDGTNFNPVVPSTDKEEHF